ncbi:bud site selection protein [Tilletia horrida]|uniref:Bud site selection protein n=1 Tax=Tilletia horrida TaxID=155126 RepID=A0AAN6GRC4_9BASI|nr:bud site selection protein [Tilletia horrida]KAK0553964.1 bud site selection protein [Tilletia horrida]KAK0565349.1 bud site selection protein [Tilletia horrida]
MESFVSQPEFFETEVGESIISRTETLATFRELGPPDLCHFVKVSTSKSSAREIGSYHYVSGVDASSSAALAAYINSLTYELDQNPGFFSNKSQYKLKSGAYCCFNAFSRVDVRVVVRIPGSVDAYVVDLRGERHECTPEIWQEVYLSALLRSILYADDANYRLAGYRKLDPIASPEAEHRFLQAAENLFFKGWQLGSDPEIQVATVVSNHLTNGILKYFGESFRFEIAVNLFEKLYAREPEVAALVAKAYVGMNEELKAVQIMHHAIAQSRLPTGSTLPHPPLGAATGAGQPLSYALLHVQADFLRSKGKAEWALKLAKQAVNSAPSEFVTWAKLTELYIDLGEWDSALFTLNSCPMFTYNERDLHRMPTPSKSHLPIKNFIAESGLVNEESSRDNEADVALLRLPAPALRGTFSKAYGLLTRLVSAIGWDELLKCRSAVFVMEEEYRMQKAGGPTSPGEDGVPSDGLADAGAGINGGTPNGVTAPAVESEHDERAAQRRERDQTRTRYEHEMHDNGVEPGSPISSPESSASGSPPLRPTSPSFRTESTYHDNGGVDQAGEKLGRLGISSLGAAGSAQSIPTIKISTESDHEREKLALEEFMKNESEAVEKAADESTGSAGAGDADARGAEEGEGEGEVLPKVEVTAPPLEKPAQVQVEGRHERVDSSAAAPSGLSGAAAGANPATSGTVDTQASGVAGAQAIQAQLHQDAEGAQSLQRQSTAGPAPGAAGAGSGTTGSSGASFANKRLCERWLDNLFMVLYEDLRVYTIWRAEVAHYRAQNLAYRKTGTEWEILGELALRLHHSAEARDAFQRCVETKFSAKALLRLLEIYTDAKDVQRSLWTAIRLTAYHHRWYMEGSFPGAVAHNLFKLIRTEGLAKVSYTLVSMSPPQPILKLMQNYFAYAQTFGVPGFNF